MLHGSAVGNTSKTGRSTSPAAEVSGKIPASEIEGKETLNCCAQHALDGMVDVKNR